MKISVCIATYNGEKYIKEQVLSILNQLKSEDEVIISDDCSIDNTLHIIHEIKDKRIFLFEGVRFASPKLNFENAIKRATGDVIFLSDQDDVWLPDKIKISIDKLQKADLVFSNVKIINGENELLKDKLFQSIPDFSIFNLLLNNQIIGATVAFKKHLLTYALPFPPKIPMHDQWLGVLAAYFGKIEYIDEPLILYRRHSLNASYFEKSKNSLITKIGFRYNILNSFIRRIIQKKDLKK